MASCWRRSCRSQFKTIGSSSVWWRGSKSWISQNVNLTREEEALREILAALIEVYDDRFSLPEQPPHEMVKYLMEQRGLKQADLVPVFGSRAQASGLVNGKRGISKAQVKKLAQYFGVSAELFL